VVVFEELSETVCLWPALMTKIMSLFVAPAHHIMRHQIEHHQQKQQQTEHTTTPTNTRRRSNQNRISNKNNLSTTNMKQAKKKRRRGGENLTEGMTGIVFERRGVQKVRTLPDLRKQPTQSVRRCSSSFERIKLCIELTPTEASQYSQRGLLFVSLRPVLIYWCFLLFLFNSSITLWFDFGCLFEIRNEQ